MQPTPTISKRFRFFSICMILALSLIVALLQGIPTLQTLPRGFKLALFGIPLLLTMLSAAFLACTGRLSEERMLFLILLGGMLFRCSYVVLSGLYERQHDEGAYTGIADSTINPGHIGYIEYIYKFKHLPDMNPYQLFSYYHPPLHYVISGLWLILLTGLGMPEALAFENLQILPLVYSGLFLYLTVFILKRLGAAGRPLYAGIFSIAFFPALVIMSGSINNDMLSNLLLACCILLTLRHIQAKSTKNLLLLALTIGLGMICKINTAIIALPIALVFLWDFIQVMKTGTRKQVMREVRGYLLFGLISGGIGLSFIIRNLILFHVKPGISSATESSLMYTGAYGLWERIGIPSLSAWHFEFPFHPLSGDVIHNIWVILFQTSLFAEIYPMELSGISLFLSQAAYVTGIAGAVFLLLLFTASQLRNWNEGKQRREAVFLLCGYYTFLFSFVLFSLKYPYTCSSDFRYIVICLPFLAAGLAYKSSRPGTGRLDHLGRLTRLLVFLSLICACIAYMTWRVW